MFFYLNGAKFRGYDENEKGPPLDRGTFSFSAYPLNFALIKSETRFPRRDGNAFKKDFANLKMLISGDFKTDIWRF